MSSGRNTKANIKYTWKGVIYSILVDNPFSFTIAEQQDRIHVLEGADPSIIDEFTRVPIKQENLLVKVYARSNDQETKQPSILRYHSFILSKG